jgi:hypothetical protein
MVRRYIPALSILGVLFVVAAASSQAGWGHHSGSSYHEESMRSESRFEYHAEQPVETGTVYQTVETRRLPDSFWVDSNKPIVNENGGQLFRQSIDDGP